MSRDFPNQNPGNSTGPDSPSRQGLDWLAFRYLSDELPESEREEFEKQLETDSDAQTALVDAVQSTQLMYAALEPQKTMVELADRNKSINRPELADKTDEASLRSHGWQGAVLSAAAAILLMLGAWAFYGANSDSSSIAGNNSLSSTELAVAWADQLTAREIGGIEAGLDELADEVEFEDLFSAGSLEEPEDWMYTALVEMENSAEVHE